MFTAILLKYENLINGYVLDLFIAYSSSCGVIRIRLRQFNLHKTNAANEELVISLFLQAWSSRKKADIPITLSLYSSSNKMGIFLLAARNINHQYIVERSIYEGKNKKIIKHSLMFSILLFFFYSCICRIIYILWWRFEKCNCRCRKSTFKF